MVHLSSPYLHLYVHLRWIRAILHDPERYPDPEEFKPERFLNEDRSFRDDPAIALAFGIGRRICPGRHFVDATLFIVASSILSVFNITKAKDANGHEIPVKVARSVRSEIVVYVSGCRPVLLQLTSLIFKSSGGISMFHLSER